MLLELSHDLSVPVVGLLSLGSMWLLSTRLRCLEVLGGSSGQLPATDAVSGFGLLKIVERLLRLLSAPVTVHRV